VFVSTVLLGGSLLFGVDVYKLVINPIESMIEKVIEVISKPQKVKELAMIEQEEEDAKLVANINHQHAEDDDEDDNEQKKQE
jgi:HSP90 family molecular chaperone